MGILSKYSEEKCKSQRGPISPSLFGSIQSCLQLAESFDHRHIFQSLQDTCVQHLHITQALLKMAVSALSRDCFAVLINFRIRKLFDVKVALPEHCKIDSEQPPRIHSVHSDSATSVWKLSSRLQFCSHALHERHQLTAKLMSLQLGNVFVNLGMQLFMVLIKRRAQRQLQMIRVCWNHFGMLLSQA